MPTSSTIALKNVPNSTKVATGVSSNILPFDFYPNGNFIPAKMTMRVVRPCVNSEAGLYNYDHNGFVGMESHVRLSVQGGSFPFRFEIIRGPQGATISNDVNANDYGVLKYTPTQNGLIDVLVLIVDQERTVRLAAWTINVNADWIRFVSPAGNNANNGSYASPWQTLTYATGQNTEGRALCLLDGTYTDLNGTASMGVAGLFNTMFAYNRRQATIDCTSWTSTNGTVFPINGSNTIIQGINFDNPPITAANPRWFSVNGQGNNTHMHDCSFNVNGRIGTNNGDNISCLFFSDLGSTNFRKNITQTACDFYGLDTRFNGWSSIDTYTIRYACIEKNRFYDQAAGGTSSGVIWIKAADNQFFSIRQNEFPTPHAGNCLELSMSARVADGRTGNFEVCYNYVVKTDEGALRVLRGSGNGVATAPVWSYRNTFIGDITIFSRNEASTFISENDVVISDRSRGEPWKVVVLDTSLGNPYQPLTHQPSITHSITGIDCHLPTSANALDANGNLQGVYATQFHGTHGREISK